jgi:hypothetical protein
MEEIRKIRRIYLCVLLYHERIYNCIYAEIYMNCRFYRLSLGKYYSKYLVNTNREKSVKSDEKYTGIL